jgi:deoxyribodipyrimidine photolyase-related protein
MKAYIIYPHQLYQPEKISKVLSQSLDYIFIVEEYLYFRQYDFHPQKIKFHQSTMKNYKAELIQFYIGKKSPKIIYIASENLPSVEALVEILFTKYHIKNIICFDPTDDWLRRKTKAKCGELKINLNYLESPNFIFKLEQLKEFFTEKKSNFLMNNFYIFARKNLNILLETDGKPIGGKWSFDSENRKKIPENFPLPDESSFIWATTRSEVEKVMTDFFNYKFQNFGLYEDAIISDKNFLFHSTLSPYINVGLLDPMEVVNYALEFYQKNRDTITLPTVEGFVRQVIGWREYMRAVYEFKGREIRCKNFFGFTKKLPSTFWTGKTGNVVVDNTIKKTLKYAYNHHIERLMILGNWMLLCEYNPHQVYKWFMEMYIDSYDWVMVPNVYSMSQYSDGGLITTKPYISGSNYIKKMSNYSGKKGELIFGTKWTKGWDEKYWSFIYKHQKHFQKNPRMSMMVKLANDRFTKIN